MSKYFSKFQRSTLSLAIALSVGASASYTQETLVLEEVLVSAQKRSQSLQDVPLAITALDGEKLRQTNITTLAEMSAYVPNFQQTRVGISNIIIIRGSGSGPNNGFEQSVGTFRDGIYMGRARQTIMPLYDLARVEIVKGPQTILFGKNTIAGAVSIISAPATDEVSGYLNGTVGSFGSYKTEAAISGPLGDNVRGRIALRTDHNDGWLENAVFDEDVPELDNYAGRAKVEWDLTSDTTMTVMAERSLRKGLGSDTELISANSIPSLTNPDNTIPPQIDRVESNFNYRSTIGNSAPLKEGLTETEVDIYNSAIKFDMNFGEHSLTSITGFTGFTYDAIADLDYSPKNLIGVLDSVEKYDQISQEFQFKSPLGQTFEYITGLYLQTSTFDTQSDTGFVISSINPLAPSTTDGIRGSENKLVTDNISAFFSGTWNITDAFRLKAGVRYSYEKKQLDKSLTLVGLNNGEPMPDLFIDLIWEPRVDTSPYTVKLNRSENDTSPMVIVEYDFSEDIMLYASAIKGFKAGGYDSGHTNGTRLDLLEFEPEKAISYELGAKMTLLDGKANLNIAAFQGEFEDLQVSIFNGSAGFIVTNAAASTSRGIELDGRYLVTPELMLNGSIAWLDNTYDEFVGAPCTVPQSAKNAQQNINNGISGAAIFDGCINDLGGKTLSRSPKWAASVSANYTMTLGDNYDLVTSVDVNYRDDQFLSEDLDPGTLQKANTQVNARVALVSGDGQWTVALIGKNLTDEKILTSAADLPFGNGNTDEYFQQTGQLDYQGAFTGIVAPPRSYSIDVSYNF